MTETQEQNYWSFTELQQSTIHIGYTPFGWRYGQHINLINAIRKKS